MALQTPLKSILVKPSLKSRFVFSTLAFIILNAAASAGIVVSGETNNDTGFSVSATDLLQTNLASTTDSISVNTTENNAIGGNAALLNDGSFSALGAGGGICINGGSITYELTTAGPTGYDISEVNVYTGWNDDGRDGQNYTVSYSTVSDPGTFIDIATVTRDDAGRFEKSSVTEGTAPNLLATGVKAIRITFNGQENGGVGYKEIDVIGSIPVILPRNLTWNNGAATDAWNTTDANWTGSIWDNTRPDNAIFGSTGGTVNLDTITAGSVNVGNTGSNFANVTLAGGSLAAASLTVQGKGEPGGNGPNYAANPTLSLDTDVTISGDAAVGRANLNITGGNFIATNRIISAPASADWGRLVVSGGTVTATNGVDGSVNTTATFAIDLNGGELRTPSIKVADREQGINGDAWLTFNGGTLTAIGADNADFITTYGGGQNAYVGFGGAVIDTNSRNIGILVNLLDQGGGLTKEGAGTLTLGGANTYSGDTTVNTGTLVLADNAQLRFVVTETPASNKVTGSGAATFNGDFNIDTTAVSGSTGFIWTLVDRAALTGESFGTTFSVIGFVDPEDDGVWTMTDAKGDWSFSEASGELSLDIGTDYDTWMALYPSITNPADKLPGADPDGDGLTNQDEYAFGLIPNSGSSVNPISVPLDKTTGTFTYQRRKTSLSDLTSYKILTSTDLVTWTPDDTAGQIATDIPSTDNESVAVTLITPPTAAKFFVRVSAE